MAESDVAGGRELSVAKPVEWARTASDVAPLHREASLECPMLILLLFSASLCCSFITLLSFPFYRHFIPCRTISMKKPVLCGSKKL